MQGASIMSSAKEFVMEVLKSLPDDCSVEDIQYELYVRQAIREGEQAADDGRVVPHEQVMREMAKWLGK